MQCQIGSNSTVREWSLQRPFTSISDSMIILMNFKGRRKVINSHFGIADGMNGSVVLYTNSTDLNDAGIYTCSVQKAGRQPDRYSAQLIVFGKLSNHEVTVLRAGLPNIPNRSWLMASAGLGARSFIGATLLIGLRKRAAQ